MSADMMTNWVGHTGLDISILIVIVLLCRRPFVKMFGARAAYALWALPLFRLVLPEIPITLPRPAWMQSTLDAPIDIMTYTNLEAVVANPVSAPFNWQYPVIVLWLVVAIIWFGAQLLRQHKYIKTVKSGALPVSRDVQEKLDKACKLFALNTTPDICISTSNLGPMVAGIFRPIIVLPQNFETDFNGRQQFFALAHELAHVKRGDLWAAFGALLFRALNWPNPLVHLCAVKFRTDQEAACDAYVLNVIGNGARTKQNYAETLIHSAKVAAKVAAKIPSTSSKNSTRTSTNQSVLANPLCLTIYHPLKERLMTLKTSKNNSTILSRMGVGAFVIAALAATAPITIASASGGPKSEAPKVKTETKKVMKWVGNKDGVETNKHIEVTVKDGVTTAYNIDKDGNKTEIDASELEILEGMGGTEDMNVFVTDGKPGEKHIKIMKGLHTQGKEGDHKVFIKRLKSMDGKHTVITEDLKGLAGENSQIIVKRMSKGDDGTVIDIDSDVMIMGAEGNHAAAMVGAAQSLLEQAETMTGGKELSAKARKKLDKARKALKEAQTAIEAEQ